MSPLRFSRFSIWFSAPSSNHLRIFAKSLKVSAGICRCHLITVQQLRKDEKGQFHLFSTLTWTSRPSIQGGQHCHQVSNTIPLTSYMYDKTCPLKTSSIREFRLSCALGGSTQSCTSSLVLQWKHVATLLALSWVALKLHGAVTNSDLHVQRIK